MDRIKIRLTKILFLFALQELVCSTICFSALPEFLDQEGTHLASALKIPVGENSHILLPPGTSLNKIPSKISQMRSELGLSPDMPLDEQDKFFQGISWKTTQNEIIRSTFPGKILQMYVHSGQRVEEGEPLCIIEAMKMESLIRATSPGEIMQVFLKEGAFVSNKTALIALLPTSAPWEDLNQVQILDNKDFLMALFLWATIPTLFTDNEPSLDNGEKNEGFPAVLKNESNPLIQTPLQASSPSLLLDVSSISKSLSVPDIQNNDPPTQKIEIISVQPSITEQVTVLPEQPLIASTSNETIAEDRNNFVVSPASSFLRKQEPRTNNAFRRNAAILLFIKKPLCSPSFLGSCFRRNDDLFGLHIFFNFLRRTQVILYQPQKISIKRFLDCYGPVGLTMTTAGELRPYFNTPRMSSLVESPLNSTHPASKPSDNKEIEPVSPGTWSKWICGVMVLSLFLFALKTISYYKLSHTQMRKSYNIFYAVDFNRHQFITHRMAQNRNSIPLLKNPKSIERKKYGS